MQPVPPVPRRPPPPASSMPPPPPSASKRAPPFRPLELPLPSALVPPKKRRVLQTPPKATVPLPPPPPVPAPADGLAPAAPAPTPPPEAGHAESPLFWAQEPSPPPQPPAAEKPSSPSPSPPAAEKPSSPPPFPPAAEKPSFPPQPPAVEKPSSPPPPPSAADEKPSALPPTGAAAAAAAEPAPTRKARKTKLIKVRKIIRKVVPKGTIAARKAASGAAAAAAGALQSGKGHAPDNSRSHQNASMDEVVKKEQTFGENTVEKPATSCNPIAVCETLCNPIVVPQTLCNPIAVRETLSGKGVVGGGTLANGPAMDTSDEPEVEKLGSKGEDSVEVGMSERERRMTEVFVGGLNRDAKEEDVRAVLSVAGEITEVRMIMDATTKKNKGYCFVRYRDSAQARKAIAQFSNVKICGKQCRVAALGGNDKIFLGNIDKKWKKKDIMKLLQKIGVENIDVVTLVPDSNNPGCNRGFAFLELETYRDAQIAYKKLSRKDVFGKGLNIRVDWAEPLNGSDEKQKQQAKIKISLAKSVQKGSKNMKDHKFCISKKDKTKTARSERKLGHSSLHILPSSSRMVPITVDKKSSTTHGFLQVLRNLAPWKPEHSGSVEGSLIQDCPRVFSGEKRPFSELGIDSYCLSRNTHAGHERNICATLTSSYRLSPPAREYYSPYHHESRRCVPVSDSVLTEPWDWVQMRQACSPKSGMPHGRRH